MENAVRGPFWKACSENGTAYFAYLALDLQKDAPTRWKGRVFKMN
jgi:hypothetical protein